VGTRDADNTPTYSRTAQPVRPYMPKQSIPVIHLFAGPGGLGEGFSAWRSGRSGRSGRSTGSRVFKSALSIEKEASAHQTLRLRAFYRQFPDGQVPESYYQYLKGDITLDELYRLHPTEAGHADHEAWCVELGGDNLSEVRIRIAKALDDADPWVLLGGPPCQPFSLAGRARNRKGTQFSTRKKPTRPHIDDTISHELDYFFRCKLIST